MRRWSILLAAAGLMMCVGTAYSWSLFTRPLMAFFGWTSVQVAFAFALMMFNVGVGAVIGGILHDRVGPRAIGLAGAVLWGMGNTLAGIGTAHFGLPWLYLTYGIIGGIGAGMAYVVPGVTATKWFPDQRGLANGVVLFGFGAGSLVYNAIVGMIPRFDIVANAANEVILARNAATQAGRPFVFPSVTRIWDIHGLMDVLIWSGLAFIVIGALCALVLRSPGPGEAPARAPTHAGERDFTPREMLGTRAFYVIWAFVFVDCFAGLALLGSAVPVYSELTAASASAATLVYGWLSIFNGIGRLAWAYLSDFLGRAPSLALALVLEGLGIALLVHVHEQAAVATAFIVILLCFGGVLAIAPAMLADFYGTLHMGQNYAYLITAASVAGLAGPMLFGLLEDATGSLTRALMPIATLVVLAAILPFLMRRPPSPLAVAPAGA